MLIGSPGEKLIAFVSNSAWSVYNFRLDVIRSLKQMGYQVTVIATKDEYAVYLQDEGCAFVHVDFNNRTGNPLKDYLFYLKLRQVYSRLKPAFIFHYVTKPNIWLPGCSNTEDSLCSGDHGSWLCLCQRKLVE